MVAVRFPNIIEIEFIRKVVNGMVPSFHNVFAHCVLVPPSTRIAGPARYQADLRWWLSVSPSGWILQFGDERWQGTFLDLCGFFSKSHELARPQTDKYRRYNQSQAMKQRTRNYSQDAER